MTTGAEDALARARRIAVRVLGGADSLCALPAGNHWVFAIERGARRWVLKLARGGRREMVAVEAAAVTLAGTGGVPVPHLEHVDPKGEIAGQPFLLMRSAGTRTVMEEMASGAGEVTLALVRDMATALAATHAITPAGGHWPPLPERSSLGYARLLAALRGEAMAAGVVGRDELESFDRAVAELPPLGGGALCHGDFHAVQCVVQDGRVSAVVDWESASLGDRLVDLSLTQAYLELYARPALAGEFLTTYSRRAPLPDAFDVRYRSVRAAQALGMLCRWSRSGNRSGAARAHALLRSCLDAPGARRGT